MGLSISLQFVRLMGGEMNVENQVGRGTTFHFDIQMTPLEASDLKEARPTRGVIALAPNQPRYRILIVDDKTSPNKRRSPLQEKKDDNSRACRDRSI